MIKRSSLIVLFAAVGLLGTSAVFGADAQTAARKTPAAKPMSEETGQEILQELRQIKVLLQNQQRQAPPSPSPRPPAQPLDLSVVTEGHFLGKADAPVTLVEFTDYQCPFCKRFYVGTFGELKKNYIDTGKVKFVSRSLPLAFHKNARKAAQAALCAGDQGKYWEMRDVLFQNAQALDPDKLPGYAEGLKLNMKNFGACLESEEHLSEIDTDMKEAQSVGITGTPSFVLGKSVREGKMKGEKVVGAQPAAAFEAKIKALLGGDSH